MIESSNINVSEPPAAVDNEKKYSNGTTEENAEDQMKKCLANKSSKEKLMYWLNGSLKIKMTDGRVLVGNFFCTDRDSNVILGSSTEYLREEDIGVEQPRVLGLVMVPGRHIVSIHYLL